MLLGHHFVNTDGKSREEIVELRFKEWELRQAREREEREEAAKKLAENKGDVTAKKEPPAPKPHAAPHFPDLKKLLGKLHL